MKYTLSLILLACLVLVPGTLYAQRTPRTEITGVVYDAETEGPLPGVHVFIESTTLGARNKWVPNPYFPMEPTHQISWLQLEGAPATFTLDGLLDDPYRLTVSGYLGWERFADRLPNDYHPSTGHRLF